MILDNVAKKLHDPECPADVWWMLAVFAPEEALASPLAGLLILEDPSRWCPFLPGFGDQRGMDIREAEWMGLDFAAMLDRSNVVSQVSLHYTSLLLREELPCIAGKYLREVLRRMPEIVNESYSVTRTANPMKVPVLTICPEIPEIIALRLSDVTEEETLRAAIARGRKSVNSQREKLIEGEGYIHAGSAAYAFIRLVICPLDETGLSPFIDIMMVYWKRSLTARLWSGRAILDILLGRPGFALEAFSNPKYGRL